MKGHCHARPVGIVSDGALICGTEYKVSKQNLESLRLSHLPSLMGIGPWPYRYGGCATYSCQRSSLLMYATSRFSARGNVPSAIIPRTAFMRIARAV